jgi:hypothetical protein
MSRAPAPRAGRPSRLGSEWQSSKHPRSPLGMIEALKGQPAGMVVVYDCFNWNTWPGDAWCETETGRGAERVCHGRSTIGPPDLATRPRWGSCASRRKSRFEVTAE